ncbi:MAG: hypothetical protein QM817_06960 [Archangium sp.]
MVATSKVNSGPRPVVTAPKDPVAASVTTSVAGATTQATAKPPPPSSDFDASAKKKKANLTGGFKPVPRGGAGVGAPQLNADVKSFRAAAAVNGAQASQTSNVDKKVNDAVSRLAAKNPVTAKDLIAENAKLDPKQQHALMMALPDKTRMALDAELKKLPPDQRGEQLTWMGDKNLQGVGKDGYVTVTVAPTLNIIENGGTTKIQYASKIDLGNGKSVTTDKGPDGNLYVKFGKETLRAEKVVGGWAFFKEVKSGQQGDVIGHDGKIWRPINVATKEQMTMITAFREGATMAQNFSGRLDPGTEQVFRDRAIDAAIPGARKQLETLSKDAATWNGFAKSSADWIATNQKWLAPAVQGGHVKMTQNPDGSVSLELNRAPGMRDSEWKKIQDEFGPKVKQFGERLSKDQQWFSTELSIRDRAATGALETFRGPSFQKYLSTLSPRERLDEVTRLSQALKGTSAGVSLANELMGPDAFKVVNGKLEPANDLAKTVFGNARTPEAREAMQMLALSAGPQLSMSGADTLARTFEVLRGEPLTARQREGVEALHNIKTPKEFTALVDPDPKSPPSVLDKAGDVSDLLAELGGASAAEKLGSSTNRVAQAGKSAFDGPRGQALTAGSAFVATFQVYNSTKDLIQKGVTVDTAAAFAEDATRAVGTWGSVMEMMGKTGWLSKAGKVAGPVSDAIGLINDMRRDSSSSEGAYRNNVHVGASALILAGGLVGGPVGVAGVLVGLGVKLFFNRTSESYEEAHGTLKRLPDIK